MTGIHECRENNFSSLGAEDFRNELKNFNTLG